MLWKIVSTKKQMKMKINREHIKAIYPYKKTGMTDASINQMIDKYIAPLNAQMSKYGIDTPLRVAHFLTQILHESGGFRWPRELASGSAYEGRRDLGNIKTGDGIRYKGRGLIQLTGRANYKALCDWLGGAPDVLNNPGLVEQPNLAVLASVFFWVTKGINVLADRDDILAVTKRINGGTNGYAERKELLQKAKEVIV